MKYQTIDKQKYVNTKWYISYIIQCGAKEYIKEIYIFIGLPSDYPGSRPGKSEEQDAWYGAINFVAKSEQNFDWKIISFKYVCTI